MAKKEQWYEATLKLSTGHELEIVHNIPNTDGPVNSLQAALDNWLARYWIGDKPKFNNDVTQSFVDYINSKTGMSGYRAMRRVDYDHLNKKQGNEKDKGNTQGEKKADSSSNGQSSTKAKGCFNAFW